MRNLIAFALLGLSVAATHVTSPAQAQVSKQGDSYLFRIKWAKGQSVNYLFNTTMMGGPGKEMPSIPGSVTMKPLSVDGSGTATLSVTSQMSAMAGGTSKPQEMKVTNRGVVQGQAASAATFIELPAGPIKIGGKWTANQTVDGMTGKMKLSTTYTLRAVKSVKGKNVAEVAMSQKGGGGGMAANSTGTLLISMADGLLHSMESSMNLEISGGGAASGGAAQKTKMQVRVTVSRK